MIMKYQWLSLVLMMVCIKTSLAEQPAGDTIQNLLISPEVLIQRRAEIALTDEQVQQIQIRLENVRRQMQELQERANTATGHLATLLSSDKVDEDAALKQLDDIVAIERDQKRLNLALMIQLRNELTPEQRQAAAKFGHSPISNDALERRLKAKLSQIERAVQVRAEQGRPPFEALGLMQTFPEWMQQGRVPEAESLLDRAILILGQEKPNQGANPQAPVQPPASLAESIQRIERRAQKMQQNGEDVSDVQKLMQQLAPLVHQGKMKEAQALIDQVERLAGLKAAVKPGGKAESDDETKPADDRRRTRPMPEAGLRKRYSPEDIRAEFAALEQEDVAWRQIAWKTCLLDGIKASREQNKPLMLWVFIDRPVDDQRC
jgi:Spy/CpxP family protein refolding chaperone